MMKTLCLTDFCFWKSQGNGSVNRAVTQFCLHYLSCGFDG
jgi:hypothetical protein